MKKLKIELDLLIIILMEALILLFFFKETLLNILLGEVVGFISVFFIKKIKINKVLEIVLLIVSIAIFPLVLNQVIQFISINLLRNYPIYLLLFTFLLTAYLLARRGFHTFIKSLEISTYFFLIIKVISLILILPNINFHNFNNQLLLETQINIDFLYLSLAILFLFLSIKYLTNNSFHNLGYTLSIINPFIIKIITILSIGHTLFYLYDYPYVNLLKKIKYFDFIERMEGILSFEYLFTYFFLVSFIMLLIVTTFKSIFGIKSGL